jgi:hypothetical protein
MMAKTTKPANVPLTAEAKVILFVVAAGIDPPSVNITAHRMRAMVIRGLIDRNASG